jgi:hypothetical protein
MFFIAPKRLPSENMKNFSALPEFQKEFKRLFKKYKTLDGDFLKFKKILLAVPTGIGKNFVIIYSMQSIKIIKARMACHSLRDRSLRVIYAYLEGEDRIEFIELYYKGNKEREDFDRIRKYLKNFNKI